MAEVIRMPLLSDTMTEGKIVTWNKKVGDKVKSDDVLADVETDKATMEVTGYVDGTLLYIGVPAGEAAKINQIIAIVGKEGEDYKALLEGDTKAATPAAPAAENKAATPAPATIAPATPAPETKSQKVALPAGAKEIRMPLLSDTMTEGKIVSWNKKVGDQVKSDDVLADVETDKATMEVVGYEEGTLLYIGVEAGKAAKVNEIIAIVGKPGTDVSAYVAAEKSGANAGPASAPAATETAAAPAEQVAPQVAETASSDQRIKASPLAKKLAADKGIDLSKVNGSGDNGRITKKDIDNYTPATAPAKAASEPASTPAATAPAFTAVGQEGYTDTPLTQMRKVIARRLSESKFAAPHFYLTMEINMDNAMTARTAMNEVSPVKISFNDMVIKASAMALRQHPDVNSSWMGDFIRHNQHIHIGSALALPEGLIVPVIRFADQKSLSQIAADAKELYGKAKSKKLQPNEFSGNTFTISNLGMMDIEEFTAIINPPDSAILAVGAIKEKVVKKGDGFAVTNVMKLTLSCDHRSVDGAVGASFLQTLKKFLENPVTMLV
ncbi:pyruvate dehydrogenase complex dihydrolipoamide acetyltransferase [Ferruginibacter paludis]|uniref:pyruvate dehydrogenase complex dihydrolipoamide acetyltransferase n=1 Tax=Ferruginibacter paludis TaxID=1310417 RepID=UPI0025B3D54D|nr:pyruvate dehydrogenase complex dihydrolipoamide acetyltransferase [Ferruginibacter paludis]MDN3657716.1 pyruvate dehydrogenase complex dihydrolipoamide acetyltransferase [Ferruginibacter paludis]